MQPRERFLSGRTWLVVLALFALFFILTPYDLLSSVSGYSLAERRGEIGAALDTVEGGSRVRRVTLLVLFGAGVLAFAVARRQSRRTNMPVAASASAFLLLAALSTLWGDDPAFTLRRVVVLLILVATACGFARLWDLQTVARVTFALAGMSIAVAVAAELALGTLQPFHSEYRFRGLSHPNSMGQLCTLFMISSFVLASQFTGRRSAILLACGAVATGLLVLTKARGTLLGAGAAMVILVLSTDRRALFVLVSALVSILLGVVMFVPGFLDTATAIVSLGRPEGADLLTLTGRTDLWHDLLQYAAQRPVLGYGYDSFWVPTRILEIARSQGWIIGSSHSGYVDVVIGLGGVGLALFLTLLVSCLWAAVALRRRTRSTGALFAIGILVWLYTNMFTEVIWFQTSIPSMAAMLVVCRLAVGEPGGAGTPRHGPLRNHFPAGGSRPCAAS